jgi:lipoprotein NlpD
LLARSGGGRLAGIAAFWFLASCAFDPVPVTSLPQPPSEQIDYHIVSPGDTLFSIAWRYEKDLNALARANGLVAPYKIYASQKLSLDTSKVSRATYVPAAPLAPAVVQAKDERNKQTNAPAPKKKVADAIAVAPIPLPPPPAKLPVGDVEWRWPLKGPFSRHYDAEKIFKGINIRSKAGLPVVAAAAGNVVYAGNGLRGYGNLIIIKHSDIYLSAYAHNKKILVKENESVKSGSEIATVGDDPNTGGQLYFEIRKMGKPIDPLRLLPRQ